MIDLALVSCMLGQKVTMYPWDLLFPRMNACNTRSRNELDLLVWLCVCFWVLSPT